MAVQGAKAWGSGGKGGNVRAETVGGWAALVVLGCCPAAVPCPAVTAAEGVAEGGVTEGEEVLHLESPVEVPPNGDWGGYRFYCELLEGGDDYTPLFSCDLSWQCELNYAATRMAIRPNGYELLDDVVQVSRVVDISNRAGPRLFIDVKGDWLSARLRVGGRPILRIDGFLSGAGGSEAGISELYVGVMRTPEAPAMPAAAVSIAGVPQEPERIVEYFRAPVTCVLREEFLE
ncbi:MAG: hypothetical protein HY907_16405 [Deltaproteobacteria bacterium]|nr:hypothetical protein [Deltaproteobacteria bacterium]